MRLLWRENNVVTMVMVLIVCSYTGARCQKTQNPPWVAVNVPTSSTGSVEYTSVSKPSTTDKSTSGDSALPTRSTDSVEYTTVSKPSTTNKSTSEVTTIPTAEPTSISSENASMTAIGSSFTTPVDSSTVVTKESSIRSTTSESLNVTYTPFNTAETTTAEATTAETTTAADDKTTTDKTTSMTEPHTTVGDEKNRSSETTVVEWPWGNFWDKTSTFPTTPEENQERFIVNLPETSTTSTSSFMSVTRILAALCIIVSVLWV